VDADSAVTCFSAGWRPRFSLALNIARPGSTERGGVCPESSQKIADFSKHSVSATVCKAVVGSARKSAIGRVLPCRILTVCGEVAERLKAAVAAV
jgi:hypothetical protein